MRSPTQALPTKARATARKLSLGVQRRDLLVALQNPEPPARSESKVWLSDAATSFTCPNKSATAVPEAFCTGSRPLFEDPAPLQDQPFPQEGSRCKAHRDTSWRKRM